MDYNSLIGPSQKGIHLAEIAVAYILMGLFIIGVGDLLVRIAQAAYESVQPGPPAGIADPEVVVGFIDTALLLFIIVEIYQTVIAYSRDQDVVRIVIIAALIAVSRKIISFRPGKVAGTDDLVFAGTFSILLLVLTLTLYVLRTTEYGIEEP
ncbi:MAG: phosphate-starvation-inducible PsiE family protein [Halobacteriales archaeon]|nr:phosphate-starvation-inducible PsiE family protein [Halobacteriales archaeon]